MADISPEELEAFKEYQRRNAEKIDTLEPSIETPQGKVNAFIKDQVSNKAPIIVPRQAFWAGGIGVTALVLLTWPILVVSFILGAFTVVKLGCPCGTTKSKEK